MAIRVAAALVVLALSGGAVKAAEDVSTIRTRVPRENVDAFMESCKTGGVPSASCWCMVTHLNGTREGAFILDITGGGLRAVDRKPTKEAVLAAINRHGLKGSEAQAALNTSGPTIDGAVKACE